MTAAVATTTSPALAKRPPSKRKGSGRAHSDDLPEIDWRIASGIFLIALALAAIFLPMVWPLSPTPNRLFSRYPSPELGTSDGN